MTVPCQSRHRRPLEDLRHLHHLPPLTVLVAKALSEIALVIGLVTGPQGSLLTPAMNSMTHLDTEKTGNLVGEASLSMVSSP